MRHALLTDLIVEIHTASRGVYGARRVHAELTLGRGVQVGHGAVELLMQRAGLQGLTGRPKFRKIANVATPADRVERSFGRSERDRLWLADIERHEALPNPAVVKGHRLRFVAAGRLKLRAA